MADRVHRVTMFKIPKEEKQDKLLEEYKHLIAKNSKDGKPYILSLAVGRTEADSRSQGYTVVSKTEFANMEDMRYYDDVCPAHQELKAIIGTMGVEGIVTVYFNPYLAS